MIWIIDFTKSARKELKKLDKTVQFKINKFIDKLMLMEKPREAGKQLVGQKGVYRYRVGDYRLLIEVHDNILTISVIKVGHRKNVYKEIWRSSPD